ncbi:MAG TPA: class IV adenylate cyclase, partial [Actinomycetota bacterium]|nr:class IV adenylate cyclase [Actinomycetota bacterium]
FDSPDQARKGLESIGARLVRERTFEDNIVYDDDHGHLVRDGKLLRLRRWGDESTLTYKAKVAGEHRHKVREEHETVVDRPDAVERMLAGLGFRPVYRYQKFRTMYGLPELHACLDETPLGCFVELEGSPEAIDQAAERLGFCRDRYVLETYRELQERQARERGEEAGDLVFDEPGGDHR